jgi:hypothetical protein
MDTWGDPTHTPQAKVNISSFQAQVKNFIQPHRSPGDDLITKSCREYKKGARSHNKNIKT